MLKFKHVLKSVGLNYVLSVLLNRDKRAGAFHLDKIQILKISRFLTPKYSFRFAERANTCLIKHSDKK